MVLLSIFIMTCMGQAAEGVLVVNFDCQAPLGYLAGPLSDSLAVNLKLLQVPVASRVRWETLLERTGYSESDLDYNPPVLSRLAGELGVKGAIYGQVYTKNGLLIMDAFYIESGQTKPVDIDPMVGYSGDDILEMTWQLAVIISKDDKVPPNIVKVEPSDSTVVANEHLQFKLYFDEPMNPDSYGLAGEPENMFFTYGDVKYLAADNCFIFNVHLYPGKEYKFWVNGPNLKPFMDTTGNVAHPYQWQVITRK